MPFTTQQLENQANAAIDFHLKRGTVNSQTLQDKPMLALMRSKQKTFPGGKENITVRVKGVYSTTIQGFEHDDSVSYSDPQNIKTAIYPWKLIHSGIQISMHELLKDGISVVDSINGKSTVEHSEREQTMLANLLEDKLEDMTEGTDRGQNLMFWKDGTQDAKQVPGIKSFIVDNPAAVATVGGLPQATNAWWRNRANLAVDISGGVAAQPMISFLQKENRQLRKFGGRPTNYFAGSDMMDQIERELRANGRYTDVGWSKSGKIDVAMDDIAFKGRTIEYDPTLDDLGEAKRLYAIDASTIMPMVIEGEDMKKHFPARPENKYVFYRALTWVGGLVCRQRNANGVYAFA